MSEGMVYVVRQIVTFGSKRDCESHAATEAGGRAEGRRRNYATDLLQVAIVQAIKLSALVP